jgi:hypothetical protein
MGDGMSYADCHRRLVEVLEQAFPAVGLSDFAVANKVEELAWMLNSRLTNPAPKPPDPTAKHQAQREGWRKA